MEAALPLDVPELHRIPAVVVAGRSSLRARETEVSALPVWWEPTSSAGELRLLSLATENMEPLFGLAGYL